MRIHPVLVLLCGVVFAPIPARGQVPDLDNMDLVLQSVPDGPVAKVNGVNIGKDEFVGLYQNEIATAMMRTGTPGVTDRVRLETGVKTLVHLVQRELLFQEAQRRKLAVEEKTLDERWEAELERLKKAIPQPREGELSEEDILTMAGASREEARAELGKAMLVEKMQRQIAKEKTTKVTDKEIAEFFEDKKDAFKRPEKLHIKQIFFNARSREGAPLDPADKAKAREGIENALKRIRAGESFEAVARAVSESPDKDQGGDLGLMSAAALPPFYVEAAGSMNPGDLSGVLESQWGYHIIKLIEVVPGGEPSLDKAKPLIRQMLLSEKTNEAVDEFCDAFLNEPGYVEVYLQFHKTLATHPGLENLLRERTGAD